MKCKRCGVEIRELNSDRQEAHEHQGDCVGNLIDRLKKLSEQVEWYMSFVSEMEEYDFSVITEEEQARIEYLDSLVTEAQEITS